MNKYGLPENHYSMPIEPIEFIQANDLPFAVGNVIKYVCRYKYKDGLKDLKKAKDYIEILIKDLQAKVIEDLIQDIDDMSEKLANESTYNPNPCKHEFDSKGLKTAWDEKPKIQDVSYSRADMRRANAVKNSLCAACKLKECDIDCECNKLPPDVLANGWNKFIGEFCSIFQAVPFLLTTPVSFGENRIILQPKSFSDCKEILEYRHDLNERLRQFYKAEIELEVKL